MTNDYEVARKTWESHVPVEISLEGASAEMRPFYMMIPRCSYFGLQLQRIIQYFTSLDDCPQLDPANLVLDCMGILVKTYYPVGVLYDLHRTAGNDVLAFTLRNKRGDEAVVAPSHVLESMFMQSVKEADFLKRKADVITAMKKEDHHQLWSGVAQYKFDDFWNVNRRLVENHDGKPFLHCPLRFYEGGKPFRQIPLIPTKESGDPMLLSDALALIFPNMDLSTRQVMSQGIPLPLDTPISYLAANISYPDNFVHVVIV